MQEIILLLIIYTICIISAVSSYIHKDKIFVIVFIIEAIGFLLFGYKEIKENSKIAINPNMNQTIEIITYKTLQNGIEIPVDTFYQKTNIIIH